MRTATVLAVALVLGLFLSTARAELATPDEMKLVCQNWLTYIVDQTGDWAGEREPWIADVQEVYAGDTLVAHHFAIGPQGHVVVPILKELPPIRMYSDESNLNLDETDGLAQLLRDVMEHRTGLYIEKYGSLEAKQPRAGEVLLGRAHRDEWDRFAIDRDQFAAELDSQRADPIVQLGPLLTTVWDQGPPYNNLCPIGDGGRTVVGCVATATAQLMAYHQWPPSGTGEQTYTWSGDDSCGGSTPSESLYADFSDEYDWDNIVDECFSGCDAAQQAALAELNYEVGVAFYMDYGVCGSGAYTSNARQIMPVFFRYEDSLDSEYRDNHTAQTWYDTIRVEINAARPMLYGISRHAIVCDGYRDTGGTNQYHMNYGWGGSQNTWFAIDDLHCTWEGCHYMNESLIRHIIPFKDCNENDINDYLDIDGGTSEDCNSNTIPDECDLENGDSEDCNENDVPDECDIANMVSEDCTGNGIPDECEPDCNTNGIADSCDIAGSTSEDCTGNGIPDECEPDCNTNGIADSCDIAGSTSEDCTGNGIPDECEPDCNMNEVADSCDIAGATSEDCTGNGIPDECDIADCPTEDLSCQDCNGNEVPDGCDLSEGTSADCQANGIPDECDIVAGTSGDCTADGVPDECQADCNGNSIADLCDVAGWTSDDDNGNGVPDECEGPNFTLMPVGASGTHMIFWNTIYIPEGGGTVELELQLSRWGTAPGAPELAAYQAQVDSTGYGSGKGAPLVPVGWPSTPETGAFIDLTRDDFPFKDLTPLAGTDLTLLDYVWGSTALYGSRADAGGASYGGTLILDIPAGADGEYSIGLVDNDDMTFMDDPDVQLLPGLGLLPGRIIVGEMPMGCCLPDGICAPATPEDCANAGGTPVEQCLGDPGGNGVDDACEQAGPEEPPAPYNVPKNRYLSFDPNNGALSVAFRVELTSSVYFPGSTGVLGWVGEPDGNGIARVEADPYYTSDWPDVLHVADCEIVPAAVYSVSSTADGAEFSLALEIPTTTQPGVKFWADMVGPLDGEGWTPPNGVVSMDDIMAVIQAFQASPTAPHLSWVDLDGEAPNKVANMTDIQQAVNGFKGFAYPFSDPAACP